jgi:hypothetical protein
MQLDEEFFDFTKKNDITASYYIEQIKIKFRVTSPCYSEGIFEINTSKHCWAVINAQN